jgi:nicotinamidase-related amidase
MEQNNNNQSTALLIMDVQPMTLERLKNNKEEYLAKITKAADFAHENKISVIYVVVGFRPGFPEISPNNKSFGAMKESMSALVNPVPAIEPADNDVVVTKRRVSAFSGSDLEVVLRAKNIKHLVLTGIATSGVVLSTVREAADKDYQLTVISDLCADFDEQVHAVLADKVFPRQATVVTSEQWMSLSK